MRNRMYVVEGLPCTGKSTTARFIADRLARLGCQVRHYSEGDRENPADYEYAAHLTEDDLATFDDEERREIASVGTRKRLGWTIPLSAVDAALAERLMPFKIYEGLPWERERPVMLDRWAAFAEQASREDAVYVLECCFLQNPLCETMMRFNLSYGEIRDYVGDIFCRIRRLNPVVVYLRNSQVAQRVAAVASERDERWLPWVIDYHTSQGYGRANHLEGFEGYIACLEKRQEVELCMLNDLAIESLVIADPFDDWERAHRTIAEFVGTARPAVGR